MLNTKDAVHSISSCTKMFGLRRTTPSIFWLTVCCWFGIGRTLGKSISGESYSRSTHFQRGDFPGGNQRDIGAMGTGHQNGMVAHTAHPHQRLNRCYSCMSPMYEQLFKDSDLGSFFYEPRNFTAQCEEPMDTRGIGLVPCRGICLSLAQEFVIMGRKTGKRLWMRDVPIPSLVTATRIAQLPSLPSLICAGRCTRRSCSGLSTTLLKLVRAADSCPGIPAIHRPFWHAPALAIAATATSRAPHRAAAPYCCLPFSSAKCSAASNCSPNCPNQI